MARSLNSGKQCGPCRNATNLEEVVKLLEAGKIREARAKLKQAEKLHASVVTLEKHLGGGRAQ